MKKQIPTQDEYIRTAIRLPPDLHAEVKKAARAAGHTMNAELIARIATAADRTAIKMLMERNAELKALMLEMLERLDDMK